MKKLFLLSALAFFGASAYAAAPEVNLIWLNEGVQGLEGTTRQGVGHDGKLYLLNSQYGAGSQGWIEVWGPDGLEKKIQPEGGVLGGTNITSDDAGNIIARAGNFPDSFKAPNNGVFIYNPETGEEHLFNFDESKILDGRGDFWGHVSGDVLSEDGGLLLFSSNGAGGMFNEVKIANGEHVLGGQQGVKNNYWFPAMDVPFGTTGIMSNYDFLPGEAAYVCGPGTGTTPLPIYHLWYDKSGDPWVWKKDGEYITPGRNITSGFALFQMGDETYIIYSRGGNNADAFAIAKARVKKDAPADDEPAIDESELVVYTGWAMMNAEETDAKYYGTHNTAVHFNVEVAPDGKTANIYQYCPRNFVAMYEFKPDHTEGIESIAVSNDNAPVEYFNLQGAKVQNPGAGIYIKRQGTKVTKIVK